MKKFFNNSLLFAIVLCLTIGGVNYTMLYSVDEWSVHSHEKNFLLAYNRLSALRDSNKIVIIAGSNGGFSINSKMINKAFNLPVVNTCTHAGIGVRMQFETYKDLLKNGDVVIFCPEYDSGKSRLYGGSVLLRIASSHLPDVYKKVSFNQWLYLYKYIAIHYKEASKNSDCKEFDGPYSAKAINEYGDIEWEREHKDTIKLYNLYGVMDSELINYYKYIHNFAKEKGIKLVFLPPTFIESSFKKCVRQIDSLDNCLKENGIPWQARPSRYSFPDSLYFDTPYHMTPSGACKRTKILIEDLQQILNKNDSSITCGVVGLN
jgi:hypothetical protein